MLNILDMLLTTVSILLSLLTLHRGRELGRIPPPSRARLRRRAARPHPRASVAQRDGHGK